MSLAKFAVIGAAVPVLLYAISTGPPPARTGAPGEGTCRDCHDGGSGGGKVEIGFPGQMQYAPGVKQLLSVTITDADAQRYGFELSARVAADNSQAGTLAPASGESAIRVICTNSSLRPVGGCPASAPIEYIEHSSPRQANAFNIEWTPPATDVGPVPRVFDRFYRVERWRHRRSGAAGLGLSIVRTVMDLHPGARSRSPVNPAPARSSHWSSRGSLG